MFFKRCFSTVLSMSRPFTVTVEGNIGSGKTTFLNHFKKQGSNATVVAEPIETWRDCNGHNLLALMYEDPHKWSFTFQSYVQLTMLKNHTLRTPEPVKLMERSLYSARYCFVEKMAEDGILHPPAVAVLDEWFKWICNHQDVAVDLIVYLKTTPEVVYERMMQRNRAEEKKVSFEYLKSLHEFHERWLFHKTLHSCPAPVLVIDADSDLSVMEEEYDRCESQILNKVAASVWN